MKVQIESSVKSSENYWAVNFIIDKCIDSFDKKWLQNELNNLIHPNLFDGLVWGFGRYHFWCAEKNRPDSRVIFVDFTNQN